jgi:hypothetical protein
VLEKNCLFNSSLRIWFETFLVLIKILWVTLETGAKTGVVGLLIECPLLLSYFNRNWNMLKIFITTLQDQI